MLDVDYAGYYPTIPQTNTKAEGGGLLYGPIPALSLGTATVQYSIYGSEVRSQLRVKRSFNYVT